MYVKGYDSFFTEPDTHEQLACRVCGTPCEVARGVYGPTDFASAIGGAATLHDAFHCPQGNAEWHGEALGLVMERDKTASKRLRELISLDLHDLLSANGFATG